MPNTAIAIATTGRLLAEKQAEGDTPDLRVVVGLLQSFYFHAPGYYSRLGYTHQQARALIKKGRV